MITGQDREWLRAKHPGLTADNGVVYGFIEFKASYCDRSGEFLILENEDDQAGEGLVLAGRFYIRMVERHDKSASRLPAVYVQGVEATIDRHFSPAQYPNGRGSLNGLDLSSQSACLCSPMEEDEFLLPQFQFQRFFDQLVIPFLYGQLFYDREKRWPWTEYTHGAAGLLESYFKLSDSTKAQDCLAQLSRDRAWPRVRPILVQREIKGHTACFCQKGDKIRRCHPLAWRGVQRLKQDIKMFGLAIP